MLGEGPGMTRALFLVASQALWVSLRGPLLFFSRENAALKPFAFVHLKSWLTDAWAAMAAINQPYTNHRGGNFKSSQGQGVWHDIASLIDLKNLVILYGVGFTTLSWD